MAKVYYDGDADLSILDGKTIAVIGYGNQGSAQAQNMKDSGLEVIVGNIKDQSWENAEKAGYRSFYLNTAPIGRKAYQICLGIILIAVGIIIRNAFYIEWLGNQTVGIGQWFAALVTIPASIILFLLPQLEIHKLLKNAKSAVLRVWEDEYCQMSRKFVSLLHRIRKEAPPSNLDSLLQVIADDSQAKTIDDFRQNLDTFRLLIEDTNTVSTWSFEIPMFLSISGASAIPTATAIIQTAMMPFF